MDFPNFDLVTPVHPPAGVGTLYFHLYDFHWISNFTPTDDRAGGSWLVRGRNDSVRSVAGSRGDVHA